MDDQFMRYLALAVGSLLLLGECYSYNTGDTAPHLDVAESGAMVAITHDQRP